MKIKAMGIDKVLLITEDGYQFAIQEWNGEIFISVPHNRIQYATEEKGNNDAGFIRLIRSE